MPRGIIPRELLRELLDPDLTPVPEPGGQLVVDVEDQADNAAAVDECPRCHRVGRFGVDLPHALGCASA